MHILGHCAYLTSALVGIADMAFVCHRNSATDGPQKHRFHNARQRLPWCGSSFTIKVTEHGPGSLAT